MRKEQLPLVSPALVVNRLVGEVRRAFVIFVYLWALFSLFALHKGMITREDMLTGQVLAFVNAVVLAKVMFIGDHFGLGDVYRERPLIYRVVAKSALFALLLVAFYFVEETGLEMLKGKAFTESLPQVSGGGAAGVAASLIIMFIVLTPFFAFQELGRRIGSDTLFDLFFKPPHDRRHKVSHSPMSGLETG